MNIFPPPHLVRLWKAIIRDVIKWRYPHLLMQQPDNLLTTFHEYQNFGYYFVEHNFASVSLFAKKKHSRFYLTGANRFIFLSQQPVFVYIYQIYKSENKDDVNRNVASYLKPQPNFTCNNYIFVASHSLYRNRYRLQKSSK
jgi:hypothetical protein